VWQWFTLDQGDHANSGMQAFGDLLLGVAVFGALALVPLSIGLYWLRPVARVWPVLSWSAVFYAMTGLLALAASGRLRALAGNLALLSDARIGIMPLSALVLLAAGLLAPQPRWRWMLAGAALLDGAIFSGVALVHFVLPHFAS
jgi:hypothetical protein